jgi:transcriptional/translational regulatory protein YebC/TACO1
MSGHSKWSTIKHQKGAKDARRGKLFAKLIRAIEVAAREGGSNPDGNPTLADAIQKAKDNSVPSSGRPSAGPASSPASGWSW